MIAIVANIESREGRRKYCQKHNIAVEHPRASTTDDVEYFFSILRDTVGADFIWRRYVNNLAFVFTSQIDILWLEEGD